MIVWVFVPGHVEMHESLPRQGVPGQGRHGRAGQREDPQLQDAREGVRLDVGEASVTLHPDLKETSRTCLKDSSAIPPAGLGCYGRPRSGSVAAADSGTVAGGADVPGSG